MIINIVNIPHEGQNFEFTEDNIHVKGFIYPLKGGFDVSGDIKAELETECSFCADSMQIPVQEKFHEMMMFEGKTARQLKEEEINHNDLEINYLEGNEINLRPLVDELIGLNMPIQPKCTEELTQSGQPKCIEGSPYEKYLQQNADLKLKNPFDVLKTLKKN